MQEVWASPKLDPHHKEAGSVFSLTGTAMYLQVPGASQQVFPPQSSSDSHFLEHVSSMSFQELPLWLGVDYRVGKGERESGVRYNLFEAGVHV